MNRVAEMRILIQTLSLNIRYNLEAGRSAYGLLQGWRYTARSDSGSAALSLAPERPATRLAVPAAG